MVERVVGQQNVVAAVDPHAGTGGVVDDVVDELDVVRLVLDPRRRHILEPRPLSCGIPTRTTVIDGVAFDAQVCRAPLGVETPVVGIVDSVVEYVPVLHCHKINCIVVGPVDVVVFEINILRLVDFERFVGLFGAPVEDSVAQQKVRTAFAVYHIAVGRNGHISDIQIIDVGDVEVVGQRDRITPVLRRDDNGKLCRAVAIFPVIG